jgi:CRP-like cAMP-binding protein
MTVTEVAMMVKRRTLPSANKPPPTDNPNRLLAALPAADYARILPSLTVVPLKLKETFHKPGERIQAVYFPGGGFCSMLTVLEDGKMVEIATVGREGMVGVSAALDGTPVTSAAMVQGASDICYRMKVDAFRREIDRRGTFHELMAHYAQALFGFVAQSTACNAIHSVEQRLARWLLMARDRMGSDEFPLTQEFVAMMLGASRPTVTVVAGTLQKAGLIKYRHGRVTILDREHLEAASCECYRAATDLLNRVTDGIKPR